MRTKRLIARGSVAAGVAGLGLAAVLTGVYDPAAAAVAARNDETTCHATTVISVRGMGEGWSADGDGFLSPFVNGIEGSDVNAISLQYANDGVGGMGEGSSKLAAMMNDLEKRCPNTKLILAGWSLGGGVINGALGSSNPSILAAAVTFGSVQFNGGAGAKTKAFCADGDDVCGGNGSGGPGGHGSYMGEPFLSAALQFANSAAGGGGSADSGTAPSPGATPGPSGGSPDPSGGGQSPDPNGGGQSPDPNGGGKSPDPNGGHSPDPNGGGRNPMPGGGSNPGPGA